MFKYDASKNREYQAKRKRDGNESMKREIPAEGSVIRMLIVGSHQLNENVREWAGTKETKSKKSGAAMLQIHGVVCEDQDGAGSWIIEYVTVDESASPFSAYRLGQFLSSLNNPPHRDRIEASDLIGSECFVRVKHDEWNGSVRAKVKVFIPWDEVPGHLRGEDKPEIPVASRDAEAHEESGADDIPF